MRGQWAGRYELSVENFEGNEGYIWMNVDHKQRDHDFEAFVLPDVKYLGDLPHSKAFGRLNRISGSEYKSRATVQAIDMNSGNAYDWDQLKHRYPETEHGKTADIQLIHEGTNIKLNAITDIGMTIKAVLNPFVSNSSMKVPAKIMGWVKFKEKLLTEKITGRLFRGQENNAWRLKTSFHRRKRYNMHRFITEDLDSLHRKLSPFTSHYYDLRDAGQVGAFLNLAQHHGYPTPLLDWTKSPYVAAYFAFKDIERFKNHKDKHVRIYMFDRVKWETIEKRYDVLSTSMPHLSFIEFYQIGNDRAIPQQGVSSITNIEDIERFVLDKQQNSNEVYIQAIDIPYSEYDDVNADLKMMGITDSTMFPGLDSLCRELKEENFKE